MENPNFIAANDLPIAEGKNISVLCVENGEMKQKPATGLGGGNICYCAYMYDESAVAIYNSKVSRDNAIAGNTIDYDNIVSLEDFKNMFFTKSPLLLDMKNADGIGWATYGPDVNVGATIVGFFPYNGIINMVISNSTLSAYNTTSYQTLYEV